MNGLAIPAVIIAVVLLFIILNAWLSAKRRKELMQWAAAKALRFSSEKDSSMDQRFPEFGCLRQGSNQYAYNIMEGDWSGRPIAAFDYHYETHSTDSKGHRQTHHHCFSAVVLRSNVPLKPLFIRHEGFLDKITEFFGYDDIDFESAEFSRKFYVKAEDRRWAYDVIHPRTMQFLLDSPQFTLQFAPGHVIAWREKTFSTADFESAANIIQGVLDRLPEYLVKQMTEQS